MRLGNITFWRFAKGANVTAGKTKQGFKPSEIASNRTAERAYNKGNKTV